MKIKEMTISARAKVCLLNAGYEEVSDLEDVPASSLRKIKNMSQSCVNEVMSFMIDYMKSENHEIVKSGNTPSVIDHYMKDENTPVTQVNSNISFLHRSIQTLHLSIRTIDCLHRAGIYTVEQLCSLTESNLRSISYLGFFNRKEIIRALEEDGLSLATIELH